jgi:hypothetical protein
MEKPVNNVIDDLPVELKPIFTEVIGERNEGLLSSLRTHEEPSRQERIAVEQILSNEFSRNLGPDYEPTARGRDIDNALGAFLLRWPIEAE